MPTGFFANQLANAFLLPTVADRLYLIRLIVGSV